MRRAICPCPRLFWKSQALGAAQPSEFRGLGTPSKSAAKQAVLTKSEERTEGVCHGARGDKPGPRAIFPSEPQESKTWDQSLASCKRFPPPTCWPRMAPGRTAAGWEPGGPQGPPDLGWLLAGATRSVTWQ